VSSQPIFVAQHSGLCGRSARHKPEGFNTQWKPYKPKSKSLQKSRPTGVRHPRRIRPLQKISAALPTSPKPRPFSVMWERAQHCSYKSQQRSISAPSPRRQARRASPAEKTGVVDIGDGLVRRLKIESHNHPSYVNPSRAPHRRRRPFSANLHNGPPNPAPSMSRLPRFGEVFQRSGDVQVPSPRRNPRRQCRSPRRDVSPRPRIAHYGTCSAVPTVGGDGRL